MRPETSTLLSRFMYKAATSYPRHARQASTTSMSAASSGINRSSTLSVRGIIPSRPYQLLAEGARLEGEHNEYDAERHRVARDEPQHGERASARFRHE